jgi:hypothetical protein
LSSEVLDHKKINVMETTQQTNFLQEKIQEIGSAICYNLSDAVLKLPTSIITKLKVDDYGYVWFFVQKPNASLQVFDAEFPVRLDFYKKGAGCYVQAEGKAWVVTDPEEAGTIGSFAEGVSQQERKSLVLVKVKILRAEYYETKTSHGNSWWQNAVNSLSAWFGTTNQYRPGSTYFPAS